MKAIIDHSKCAGIGLCEATAPHLFEVTDDGQARVLVDDIAPDELPTVQEAVGNCPTEALSVRD